MLIPKIIHYCWFGGKTKPDIINKCIESWKYFFDEYEIIEWNESNYNIHKNAYISEAYYRKKWAFVSDYARFDVLYDYGGIYFDTDVEVIKRFPEEMFNVKGFTGVESTNTINPGLIFACIPKLDLLNRILDIYNHENFVIGNKERTITVNERVTELFLRDGFIKNGQFQVVNDILIYPSEYFCGFDLDIFEPNITDKTLCIHHYASSWKSSSFHKKRKIQSFIKKLIGVENYRKMLISIRNLRKYYKKILHKD